VLNKEKASLLLLPVLVVVFGVGVARLFQLRFESGDIYPPYSSLRADPLGTKAFYQSLENLRELLVQRFLQPLDKLREGRDTTLFVFGADPFEMRHSTEGEYKKLEQFMFDGGRIVISFAPSNTKPPAIRREEAEQTSRNQAKEDRKSFDPDQSTPTKRKRPVGDDEDLPGVKRISLKERWNVAFAYQDLPKAADDVYQSVPARKRAELELPAALTWHTALYFNKPGPNWKVIYAREKHPVLIERRFGRGALVFSADSYFLSNEAMRKERQPALLAWLVGAGHNVLFDETHLGVTEQPGIAALVRAYRLSGLVIGLMLLAGLFVWKNAVPFVPVQDQEPLDVRGDAVAGRDSAAGFVNLLRRGISPSDLLPVCVSEWKKSHARGRAGLAARTEQIAAVIAEEAGRPARERNTVESYQRISRILSERQ